jgi:WD40 repeat protein
MGPEQASPNSGACWAIRQCGVAFSPDGGQLAATGLDNTVSVFDASTGDQLLILKGNTAPVVQLAFNPQGTQLAGASEGGVIVWDLATGKEVLTLNEAGPIFATAFSPDGKRLATGGLRRGAALWDAATGEQIFAFFGHTRPVSQWPIARDGARLATASGDGTVKIWDAESGKELFTLFGPTGQVYSLGVTSDGSRLVTAGHDGIVRVYLLSLDDLVELARSRITRSLTSEECQKYLHMDACPQADLRPHKQVHSRTGVRASIGHPQSSKRKRPEPARVFAQHPVADPAAGGPPAGGGISLVHL